jgi:hypothetical protein
MKSYQNIDSHGRDLFRELQKKSKCYPNIGRGHKFVKVFVNDYIHLSTGRPR